MPIAERSPQLKSESTAFAYGLADREYASFTLEQQAHIVGDWFASAVPIGSNQTGIAKDTTSGEVDRIVDEST